MTLSKTNRLDWVDVARGIAILLMVVGHTSIPEPFSKFIYSFHMPFFFFVSGMFYSEKKYTSFASLLKRRSYTLLIPYLFFSVIVMMGYWDTEYWKPEQLYLGWYGYALWFIPVLFMSEFVLYFYAKHIKGNICTVLVIMFLLVLSKWLAVLAIHLPFKVDAVPLASTFIITGYALRNIIRNYQSPWIFIILSLLISAFLSQLLPKTGIGRNEIGWVLPNYLNALIGVFFTLQFSIKLLDFKFFALVTRALQWCGKNTLFILAFSQLFNYWILVSLNLIQCAYIVSLLLRYVLLFALIYIAQLVLNKFVPFFVGKK